MSYAIRRPGYALSAGAFVIDRTFVAIVAGGPVVHGVFALARVRIAVTVDFARRIVRTLNLGTTFAFTLKTRATG